MFCIFNWTLVIYTWFFIKEVSTYLIMAYLEEDRVTGLLINKKTKGKSLEEMEARKSYMPNTTIEVCLSRDN